MSQMPDGEMRNALFMHYMHMLEMLEANKRAVALMESTIFSDLTPRKWAEICSYLPAFKDGIKMIETAAMGAGAFIDDDEAVSLLKRKMEERIEQERHDGLR